MSNTVSKMKQVRFYTALDPYYYTVDNRPLQDINDNITTLCHEIDLIVGGSDRAAHAAATVAASSVGENVFVADLEFPGGLLLTVKHGYMVRSSQIDINNPTFQVPTLALHDKPTRFLDIQASTTPGRRVKYLIQGRMDEPNENSRIPASTSLAKVATLTIKKSAEYVDTAGEPTLAPDANHLAIASFTLGYGQTSLTAADIKSLSWVSSTDLSRITKLGPIGLADSRIVKVQYPVTIAKGVSKISLNGSNIDTSYGKDSIDVYVTGVYQTSFTMNTSDNSISLGGAMVQSGEVNVVQRKIVSK